MTTSGGAPPTYYEGIADELDLIAESVRKNPELNHHLADRLSTLASQIREDMRLLRLTQKNS